jgi:gliding motility-associated lipoprotein GldD
VIKSKVLPDLRLTVVLGIAAAILFTGTSCRKHYAPKPRGYYRIDFPEKQYTRYISACSYSFEIPVYARIAPYRANHAEPCWINIEFPDYRGTIHLTYKDLQLAARDQEVTFNDLKEDIHTLAYKHSVKADDIIEVPFSFPDRKVYGMIYDIRGNTASSCNFYATDSCRNFLSGSLYFMAVPNYDSLAPVIQFFSKDIEHLIETLRWN